MYRQRGSLSTVDNLSRSNSSHHSPSRELRNRRALNTTPDSVSPFSQNQYKTVMDHSLNCFAVEESLSNPSLFGTDYDRNSENFGFTPLLRSVEHIYVREEPIEQKLDDSFLLDSMSDKLEKPTKIWIMSYMSLILVSLILLALIISCVRFLRISSPNSVHSTTARSSLLAFTNKLNEEFPMQTTRLWAQIRSALEPLSDYFLFGSLTGSMNSPVVILLVNQLISANISVSANDLDNRQLENRDFSCFISRFRDLVNQLFLHKFSSSCPSFTVIANANNVGGGQIEQAILKFDESLIAFYGNRTRCFLLESIDLFPRGALLLLHGITDTENSAFKNSILLLTLAKSFQISTSAGCLNSPRQYCMSPSKFEHEVSRFLRSLWLPELGNEEVDALLSRVTPNIAVFQTFEHTSQVSNSKCLT